MNPSRTIFAYERHVDDEPNKITPKKLEEGAIQICKALWAKHTAVDGKSKSVGGDMTKVRYVLGLSYAARKLLQNLEHTSNHR